MPKLKLAHINIINISIAIVLSLIYLPLIWHWYDGWFHKNISIEHEYFSHGLLGFPYAIYVALTHWKKWQNLPNKSNFLGLILVIIAGLFYCSKINDLINLSFPLMLAGICLFMKSFAGLQSQNLCLILVLLATPNSLPYLIEPYTFPLQKLIAYMAGGMLQLTGLDVILRENYLYIGSQIIEVAPHCAGLKMLFTSLYVSIILLHWTHLWWHVKTRCLFLLFAALLSMSGNIIRNTLLTFFHGTNQEHSFAWLHEGLGGDIYSACLLGILVLVIKIVAKYKV